MTQELSKSKNQTTGGALVADSRVWVGDGSDHHSDSIWHLYDDLIILARIYHSKGTPYFWTSVYSYGVTSSTRLFGQFHTLKEAQRWAEQESMELH